MFGTFVKVHIIKLMDRKTDKSLGQHWLKDDKILGKIVDYADIGKQDIVVEIGPGLGTLTKHLLSSNAKVKAVEFDKTLAKDLYVNSKKLFGEKAQNLEIINQDILKFRFDKVPKDFKIVANIPYYLTSNLIRIITELENRPDVVVLLIQKEVAERICAKPGQASLLSVWAQTYFSCSLGMVVKAEQFTPPPKVDSQVVTLDRLKKPRIRDEDKKAYSTVLRAGFSNRRKTLHNSLANGLGLEKDQSAKLLERSYIDLLARPQELAIKDWIRLAEVHQQIT